MLDPRFYNMAHDRCAILFKGQLGQAYARTGDVERARETLRKLDERAATTHVSPNYFAYVYAGLGETNQAIDWLERAVKERTGPAYGMKGSLLPSTTSSCASRTTHWQAAQPAGEHTTGTSACRS